VNGDTEGKFWTSRNLLRAGRLETLEIVLDDTTVSRRHAEIRATPKGWELRDLESTNGTFLNGIRIEPGVVRRLRPRDIVQFGKVTLLVEAIEDSAQGETKIPLETRTSDPIVVEAATSSSWEMALEGIAYDRNHRVRPDDQLQALLRASKYLGQMEREEELLHSILNDAVRTLDAQRGAIVLAEGIHCELKLRALATGRNEPAGMPPFSQSIAQRSYSCGQSILCSSVGDDPELATAQSIHEGAMASVVCVLLRTPRKRLGVLHLDRSYWQKPFTEDDLHLADALAASVSAGIESAQLLRQQRELHLNTINVLAQAVELRDRYTGNHTSRVTLYALLLGKQLGLSPEELDLLSRGTPLHDIGKIGIDDAILRKANMLTPEEKLKMQEHTITGAAIVAMIPDLVGAIPIVRSHHEQWNGTGYPDGLAGDAIPRLARIVAVADAFDAMTSDRPYRKGMMPEAGFMELDRQSGNQFDPECVMAFLAIRDMVIKEMQGKTASDVATLPAVPRNPSAQVAQGRATRLVAHNG
jgi:HD-GYP domain-containing protein (c-di-GMP phosphodiesterase class II)